MILLELLSEWVEICCDGVNIGLVFGIVRGIIGYLVREKDLKGKVYL